jgi:hypothetical protein
MQFSEIQIGICALTNSLATVFATLTRLVDRNFRRASTDQNFLIFMPTYY